MDGGRAEWLVSLNMPETHGSTAEISRDADPQSSRSGKAHLRRRRSKDRRTPGTPDESRWLRRLGGYSWRYRKNVLLAFGASLVGMAVSAVVPLVTKLIIDDVITAHTRPLAPWAVVLLLAAAVVLDRKS